MKMLMLPCEIYHREFDAKLLLACEMASKYNIYSIIGYDKFFFHAAKIFKNSVIMDKSCSTIVWRTRMKDIIIRNGKSIISDEEGFNGLHNDAKATWYNRVDKEAAKYISRYACWGEYDYNFYHPIAELQNKMKIMGNCRSDLLGDIGLKIYEQKMRSMQNIYGNYILCMDNFVVEHRDKAYAPPKFNTTKQDYERQLVEFKRRAKQTSRRRDIFADYLENAVKLLPYQQFVFRPHPISDYRWWTERFWNYRNFHICTSGNVEPWIHGSKCLISMGCTTGFQAMMCKKPVIEIEDPNTVNIMKSLIGQSSQFTSLRSQSKEELLENIIEAIKTPQEFNMNNKGLEKFWYTSKHESATKRFGKYIRELADQTKENNNDLEGINILKHQINKTGSAFEQINQIKWDFETYEAIERKVYEMSKYICNNKTEVGIKKIVHGLFVVFPKNT